MHAAIKNPPCLTKTALVVLTLIGWLIGVPLPAEVSLQAHYLRIYLEINKGAESEKQRDYLGALVEFKSALSALEAIHRSDPYWEPALVNKRIEDARQSIDRLQTLATQQVMAEVRAPGGLRISPATQIQAALKMEQEKNYAGAFDLYALLLARLEIWHQVDPKWEVGPILDRIKECQEGMARMDKVLSEMSRSSEGDGRTVQ